MSLEIQKESGGLRYIKNKNAILTKAQWMPIMCEKQLEECFAKKVSVLGLHSFSSYTSLHKEMHWLEDYRSIKW